MIYQDLALFNNFDVTKNIFVGREYTSARSTWCWTRSGCTNERRT